MTLSRTRLSVALLAAAFGASCGAGPSGEGAGPAPAPAGSGGASPPAVVQPGAPGQPSRVLSPGEVAADASLRHTEADVRFMQGMIPHHAQALDMAALVASRTDSRDIHLLARRIEVSQLDEIRLMRRWLQERGEHAPDVHDHHVHGDHGLMPGMLTAAEMTRLAEARGADFDRLFLEAMIRHHEGALVMVAELFSSPAAGQEPEIFQFASHVDADQSIEIQRMRRMLEAGR